MNFFIRNKIKKKKKKVSESWQLNLKHRFLALIFDLKKIFLMPPPITFNFT